MQTQTPTMRTRARTPNNKTTTGFRISDALWAVLEPEHYLAFLHFACGLIAFRAAGLFG